MRSLLAECLWVRGRSCACGNSCGSGSGAGETQLSSVLFLLGASSSQAPGAVPWGCPKQGVLCCLSLTLDERLGGYLLYPTAFQYCSISQRRKPSFQMQVEWRCARSVSLGHLSQ